MYSLKNFPTTEKSLSVDELNELINLELNDKFTGQIRVTFHSKIATTLFIQHGKVRQIYIRNHRIPNLNWKYPLALYGDGTPTIEPMPARALMFKKVILEELKPRQPKPAKTSQLRSMFDHAAHNSGPILLHLQWESAEGFVLVGNSIPLRQAVLFTQTASEEGSIALNHILAWDEAECKVTAHLGDIKNQAWLEVHLNLLFEWYCGRILEQYEQLTGSVMLQSIIRRIYILSIDEGWNIEPQQRSLKDTSLFPSAALAGQAYRRILSSIKEQIEPIIGKALSQRILDQAYSSIAKDIYKTIAEVFELIGDRSA